ncbi:MAG: ribonuclease III [Gomphosphaeria aponina SAG 52.96 = DSM 107014]|uniref:Ribonuclease 3 n=1 Tax=Gomphosphaeria aponina SAG 52.96 = DSM 107014 TaxID=1521640 RepID=A0A941GVC6_9CHRO|nr:ribonuclease III [Gomphosphaeria aponina SAG 52.96 = DSM 107014]
MTQRQEELEKLVQKLGLPPRAPVNWMMLDLALTHPSYAKGANYQQLEFVGDSVIRLVAAEVLLESYPDASVGEFSALRSRMVSDRTLALLAQNYELDRYLLVANTGGMNETGKISVLADAFEAVLGALYLSSYNMSLIRPWLDPALQAKAAEVYSDPAWQNYKDALQEWTQAKYKLLPQYRVRETKNMRFIAEVWLQDQCLGKGTGSSKKEAEQAAAKNAFLLMVDS